MDAEQAQYQPVAGDDDDNASQKSPFFPHTLSTVPEGEGLDAEAETESDKRRQNIRTKSLSNPVLNAIHTVGDVLGHGFRGASFTETGSNQSSMSQTAVPLLAGGPASVGGVMSQHNNPPSRTVSIASQQYHTQGSHHSTRALSIVDIENATDDDLRPLRSMSVA